MHSLTRSLQYVHKCAITPNHSLPHDNIHAHSPSLTRGHTCSHPVESHHSWPASPKLSLHSDTWIIWIRLNIRLNGKNGNSNLFCSQKVRGRLEDVDKIGQLLVTGNSFGTLHNKFQNVLNFHSCKIQMHFFVKWWSILMKNFWKLMCMLMQILSNCYPGFSCSKRWFHRWWYQARWCSVFFLFTKIY